MPFESRVFALAKDAGHPEEYQDAYALDARRGIAVVADGVATAIFSRQWAGILAAATLADPPDTDDEKAFATWLACQRRAWSEQIDTTGLAWFQKAKLPLGAFSTLLWIQVAPVADEQEGSFGAQRLQCFAIGDSCLFHIRHGAVLRTFPVEYAAELTADPVVLGSVDLSRDELMKFVALDEPCFPDDILVLCTDAIADWALRRIESSDPPDWNVYWNMTQAQWADEVLRLRDAREMRYDDATLVLLRVREEGFVPPPEPAGCEQDGTVEIYGLAEDPASCAGHAAESPATTAKTPKSPKTPEETVDVEVVEEPPAGAGQEWKEKFKAASEQFGEGVELATEQALRSWKKWKKIAAEKYRDKFGPKDGPGR